MSESLFRKEAQQAFFTTEARGGLLAITPPSGVAVFGVLALVSIALALVAVFGRVQIYAEGRGVVWPDHAPIVLRAPFDGTVLSVGRAAGERGKAGEVLVTLDVRTETTAHDACAAQLGTERGDLASLEGRLEQWNAQLARDRDASLALVLLSQIRTEREKVNGLAQRCDDLGRVVARSRIVLPGDAVVQDVAVGAGSQVQQGDTLATLVPADAKLVGYLIVPEAHRGELAPGRPVRLKLDALPYEDVGVGSGRVTRVLAALPSAAVAAAREAVRSSGADVGTSAPAGAVAEIALDSLPSGAPPRQGMTFTGDVLGEKPRIVSLVFQTGAGQ